MGDAEDDGGDAVEAIDSGGGGFNLWWVFAGAGLVAAVLAALFLCCMCIKVFVLEPRRMTRDARAGVTGGGARRGTAVAVKLSSTPAPPPRSATSDKFEPRRRDHV